jgi:hypothetical protein
MRDTLVVVLGEHYGWFVTRRFYPYLSECNKNKRRKYCAIMLVISILPRSNCCLCAEGTKVQDSLPKIKRGTPPVRKNKDDRLVGVGRTASNGDRTERASNGGRAGRTSNGRRTGTNSGGRAGNGVGRTGGTNNGGGRTGGTSNDGGRAGRASNGGRTGFWEDPLLEELGDLNELDNIRGSNVVVPTGSKLFNIKASEDFTFDAENSDATLSALDEQFIEQLKSVSPRDGGAKQVTKTGLSSAPRAVLPRKRQKAVKDLTPKTVRTCAVPDKAVAGKESVSVQDNAAKQAEQPVPEVVYCDMPVSVIKTEPPIKGSFAGDICSYAGTPLQNDARGKKDGDLQVGFGWADLTFQAEGELAGDTKAKFVATIELPSTSAGIKENYIEVSSPYGTVQVGNVKGPDGTMLTDGTAMLGGTGGTDGSFFDLFNLPPGIPNFQHLSGYSKRATKLVYYTSRMLGLQLGIGFCPNPNHFGWGSMGSQDYSSGVDDSLFTPDEMRKRTNIALGLNSDQEFGNLSVSTALVAVREKTTMMLPIERENKGLYDPYEDFTTHSVKREVSLQTGTAYQASASVKYKWFQIAAGFTDNGSVNLPGKAEETNLLNKFGLHLGDSGKVWNVGCKYSFGCLDIGLTRNVSRRNITGYEVSKGDVTTLTVECQITPGLRLFAEIDRVNAKTDEKVAAIYGSELARNKGTTVMCGTKISF